jgi:glycosyltransferase involved in cell wall biosynthesis
MTRGPISACLIVKNEERVLADCLSSIQPFVEEIVLVDTGSTDATIEIARTFGASVYSIAWPDSFAAARNYALDKATQPFILAIDADERLAPDTAGRLVAHCRHSPPIVGSVTICSTGIESAVAGGSRFESLRLFPNDPQFRFTGRIHEQLRHAGRTPANAPTGVELTHVGYTAEAMIEKDKLARNLRMLHLDLLDNPDDAYILYQIGRTYQLREQFAEATQYLTASLRAVEHHGEKPPYLPSVLIQLAYAWLGLRQLAPLLEVVGLGLDLYPDFTDLYFVYGSALLELGGAEQLGDIPEVFESCLALGEPDPTRYESVLGVGSYRALHNLGAYCQATGSLEAARDYYRRAAEYGFPAAVARLKELTEY